MLIVEKKIGADGATFHQPQIFTPSGSEGGERARMSYSASKIKTQASKKWMLRIERSSYGLLSLVTVRKEQVCCQKGPQLMRPVGGARGVPVAIPNFMAEKTTGPCWLRRGSGRVSKA
jgi:hypothetical protein